MSELSEEEYRKKTREIIDSGIHDPDLIFQKLVQYYLFNDPVTDWFYDTQDDMEELFDGLADILAENFKGQPHGSKNESDDAKRFRKVRNWVENMHYNSIGELARNSSSTSTNLTYKFNRQMDKLMHLLAGAAVAANFGETFADVTSFGVEIGDATKKGIRYIGRSATVYRGPLGVGYDSKDLQWGLYGSDLQNSFDLNSDTKARKLAMKFGNGTFKLSMWQSWYKGSNSKLYD